MPAQFKRICSVIDDLPSDVQFESQESDLGESGLSQGLESHHLSGYSNPDAASLLDDAGSVSSRAASSRDVIPEASLSRMGERAHKKLRVKKRARPEELDHQRVKKSRPREAFFASDCTSGVNCTATNPAQVAKLQIREDSGRLATVWMYLGMCE
jgi:hypothetical protein